jgi:hypothetical protein
MLFYCIIRKPEEVMQIKISSDKKKTLILSKRDWLDIGKKAGFTQNRDPKNENFMAGTIQETSVPTKSKNAINKAIVSLGNYHESIPIEKIFTILETNNVIPLQEDNTVWSGFLVGNASCGDDKAKNQVAHIMLACKVNDEYMVSNNSLYLSWCKMPSGKTEIVAYVS